MKEEEEENERFFGRSQRGFSGGLGGAEESDEIFK